MAEHAALALLVALVAALYSSVGHGGASGYLAVLALFGFAPAEMKTSALALNLLAAGIAFSAFRRAGHFDGRLFWPFAAASVPMSFVGGRLEVPPGAYSALLAATLAFAAWRMLRLGDPGPKRPSAPPGLPSCAAAGAAIGLLSGLVGVGGGIFLSPLLILRGWSTAKGAAAVSAAFIWVNSAAGLLGHASRRAGPDAALWPLAAAACAGALAGSRWGAFHWGERTLRRALAVVLALACAKLLRSL